MQHTIHESILVDKAKGNIDRKYQINKNFKYKQRILPLQRYAMSLV